MDQKIYCVVLKGSQFDSVTDDVRGALECNPSYSFLSFEEARAWVFVTLGELGAPDITESNRWFEFPSDTSICIIERTVTLTKEAVTQIVKQLLKKAIVAHDSDSD